MGEFLWQMETFKMQYLFITFEQNKLAIFENEIWFPWMKATLERHLEK